MLLKGTEHIVRAGVPGQFQDIITAQDRTAVTAGLIHEVIPTGEVRLHLRAVARTEPGNREVVTIPGPPLRQIAVQVTGDLPGPVARGVRVTGVLAEVHQGVRVTGVRVVVPEVLEVSEVQVVVRSGLPVEEGPVAVVAPVADVPGAEEADNNYINRHSKKIKK